MNKAEAIKIIITACQQRPEEAIAACQKFHPGCADIVRAVRSAQGPLSGVAAEAVQYALGKLQINRDGKSHCDTDANIVALAALL